MNRFNNRCRNNKPQSPCLNDKSPVSSCAETDFGPDPYVVNIKNMALQNNYFRTALWTGSNLQLTLMSIPVGQEIGVESHSYLDQFIRVEEGQGLVSMGNCEEALNYQNNICDDCAIFVPAGTSHNIVNTGVIPLKLYSIYAPPQHPKGTVHKTKADAMKDEHEH